MSKGKKKSRKTIRKEIGEKLDQLHLKVLDHLLNTLEDLSYVDARTLTQAISFLRMHGIPRVNEDDGYVPQLEYQKELMEKMDRLDVNSDELPFKY